MILVFVILILLSFAHTFHEHETTTFQGVVAVFAGIAATSLIGYGFMGAIR